MTEQETTNHRIHQHRNEERKEGRIKRRQIGGREIPKDGRINQTSQMSLNG